MTVNEIYELCQIIVNKNQQGYLTPDDFNTCIGQAQLSFFNYLLGEFQQYRPDKPIPRVEFGENRTVRQRLTPFIYQPNFILSIDSSGFASYPGDYEDTDAMLNIYNQRIRFAPQHKLSSYLKSVIDPVTTNPIYLIEPNGFRFYPNTQYNGVSLNRSKLSYVRTPPRIHWGSVNNIYGQPVYDTASSEDPLWYDTDILEIIARALRMVGVNLQANEVSQYANEIKERGQ